MSQTAAIDLPQLDSDIEAQFVNNVQTMLSDIATGRVDTASLKDVPVGEYPGVLVGCRLLPGKDFKGEITFPKVVFQVRTEGFTTSVYNPIDARSNRATGIRNLLSTFFRLLGAEGFEAVRPPTTEDSDFENLVSYFGSLCMAVNGHNLPVMLKVSSYTTKDGETGTNGNISLRKE